jgi:hypothetical protein
MNHGNVGTMFISIVGIHHIHHLGYTVSQARTPKYKRSEQLKSKTGTGLFTVTVSVLLVSISEIIKLFLNDYLDLEMHMAAIKAKRPSL